MNELNHKRLVQLYDAYETSKNIVLVLELVTGGELFEKLTELEYISEHVVVYYMKQVLQGLKYMHQKQILHLDLKVSLLAHFFEVKQLLLTAETFSYTTIYGYFY